MKLSEIKATNWSLSLQNYGDVVQGVAEISQSIFVIVTTKKGTDPLRPEFGSDIYEYVDRPITEAVPLMIKAAADAIALWEPRVKITRVSYSLDVAGAVDFIIEWVEITTQTTSSTKILINGTN